MGTILKKHPNTFKRWLRGEDDERPSFVKLDNWGLTIADCRRQITIELSASDTYPVDKDGTWVPGKKYSADEEVMSLKKQHQIFNDTLEELESDADALLVLGTAVTQARSLVLAERERLLAVNLPPLQDSDQ